MVASLSSYPVYAYNSVKVQNDTTTLVFSSRTQKAHHSFHAEKYSQKGPNSAFLEFNFDGLFNTYNKKNLTTFKAQKSIGLEVKRHRTNRLKFIIDSDTDIKSS